MLRTATAKARQISVGVVGTGFAGLRCADVLLRHGCNVTMFEARNRIGGRVAQSNHLGHLVDLGPNWIHGTTDNPIMEIARQTGTKLHDSIEEGASFDVDGKPISVEDQRNYTELLWGEDGLIPAAFRYSNDRTDTIDPQTSLFDFFIERSQSFFADEPADVAARKRRQFLHTCFVYSFYIGSPATRQSLKFFWLEECIGGENPFVAGTYHNILDAVSRPAKEGAEIRFNTEVVGYTSHSAGDSTGESHGGPSIQTADGSSFSFDEVVVTIPLGCLKVSKSAFKPELPTRLSSAIDNVGYGHLDKVYVTFPSAFWEEPRPPQDRAEVGDAHNQNGSIVTAAATALATGQLAHPASFMHFLAPEYAKSTNPEKWMQEAFNFAAVRTDCAHATLLFYIQGPQSKYIADIVTKAKSDEERDAKLIEFFTPYYSRLPNYDASDASCAPKAVLATAWANDKFAGYGSYGNSQIGSEHADKDIEVMRQGMPERGIWLAGEHTAPFISLGTSTGAYQSGEGVAKRIVEAYGLKEEQG